MKNVVNILVIILIIALSIFSISYTNEYLYEDTNIQKDSDKKEIVVITSKVTTTKKKEIQKDIYPIENITDEDVFKIFNEKQAMSDIWQCLLLLYLFDFFRLDTAKKINLDNDRKFLYNKIRSGIRKIRL